MERGRMNGAGQRPVEEFAARDLQDFVERYGDVNVNDLMMNGSFCRFCGSRLGSEPLAQLYEDYLAVTGDAGTAALTRAMSRRSRSTGGGTAQGRVLTPEQRRELERWNEENPELAMTAREFLER